MVAVPDLRLPAFVAMERQQTGVTFCFTKTFFKKIFFSENGRVSRGCFHPIFKT